MNNFATHSMFYIAVLCPQEINRKVHQYKLWMREHFGCIVALKSPAHITMIAPFWLPNEEEDSLIKTFNNFQPELSPVEISLNNFAHFSNRVIFVSVNENQQLTTLQKKVEEHFILQFSRNIKAEQRPFHPHITIANRDIKPGDFNKAWQYFSKQKLDESFTSNSISLLKLSPGKWNVIAEKQY